MNENMAAIGPLDCKAARAGAKQEVLL